MTVKISALSIRRETLKKLLSASKDTNQEILLPSKTGTWDWKQTFYNKLTGESYFCECFRKAIESSSGKEIVNSNPHLLVALRNKSYKPKICHLCKQTNSDLIYCHSMYGTIFKVRYGCYIKKIEIEEGISEREAENKVRDIKGVARVGEKWINETLLFNYVILLFPNHKVEREASPAWLGKQRLDIYISELNLAIEYQGAQHYKAVKLFGGEEGLKKTKARDKEKSVRCKQNKVKLVLFTYKDNLSEKLIATRLKPYLEAIE